MAMQRITLSVCNMSKARQSPKAGCGNEVALIKTPESFCEGRIVANQRSCQLVKSRHEAQARIRHVLQRPQANPLASSPLPQCMLLEIAACRHT